MGHVTVHLFVLVFPDFTPRVCLLYFGFCVKTQKVTKTDLG